MASYRRGGRARFCTEGARDAMYWWSNSYSFALTVYRSALRVIGSKFCRLLLEAELAADEGGDCTMLVK